MRRNHPWRLLLVFEYSKLPWETFEALLRNLVRLYDPEPRQTRWVALFSEIQNNYWTLFRERPALLWTLFSWVTSCLPQMFSFFVVLDALLVFPRFLPLLSNPTHSLNFSSNPSVIHFSCLWDGLGNGYYAYIESSDPRIYNEVARLSSPLLSGPKRFRFFFHMYGRRVDSLSVHIRENRTERALWRRIGDHGNRWLEGCVLINSTGRYQVRRQH